MSAFKTKERYAQELKSLQSQFGNRNVNALPKVSKVSVNVGLGLHRQNKEMVSYIEKSLSQVTGQKPMMTYARKAIAGFKIRQGDLVGMRVTLRGGKMSDFLDRLINITLPRIRDFKGIDPKMFDRQGNLTIGFKDQVPFAELGHDVLDKPFGLTMTMTITHSTPQESAVLLQTLGLPIKNR